MGIWYAALACCWFSHKVCSLLLCRQVAPVPRAADNVRWRASAPPTPLMLQFVICCAAPTAGGLFQYPGALISALAGIGASRFLRDPPAWLHAITSGGANWPLLFVPALPWLSGLP